MKTSGIVKVFRYGKLLYCEDHLEESYNTLMGNKEEFDTTLPFKVNTEQYIKAKVEKHKVLTQEELRRGNEHS